MSVMVREATDYVRKWAGAEHDDALLFCGSGTTACIKRLQEVMGLAVPPTAREKVLEALSPGERWVVFVGPYEHHSNLLSWRQSLAEVVETAADRDGLIDMEDLRTKLGAPEYAGRPMLGSFSACSNVTGIISDTRGLARMLHEHGAFACFDFAASAPYVEIDMRSGDIEGYDAVFLSPHKFLGGPGTPGVLLMNHSLYLLRDHPPSTCGGGVVRYVNGFDENDTLYYDDIEEREDAGTPPIIQKVRTALAFWVKEYIGLDLIEFRNSFYVDSALKRLQMNENICVLGNSRVRRLPIISFLLFADEGSQREEMDCDFGTGGNEKRRGYKCREWWNKKRKPLNGSFVAKLLNDLFGIQARGGCDCAGPYGHYLLGVDRDLSLGIRSLIQKGYNGLKPGWTRVSFSYYMDMDEFDYVLDCIEFIAVYGLRLLPLYQFDWVTGDWTVKQQTFKYHIEFSTSCKRQGERGPLEENVKIGTAKASRRRSYLESACQLVLRLPECRQAMVVPEEIDPRMVLFRV